MERLIGWWVHNPVAANLLMAGILIGGLLGLSTMEREAFPNVKPYQAQIEVFWPGAAPQEVEEQIIVRIENSLKDLDKVNHIYSTAVEGMAEIEVTTKSGEHAMVAVADGVHEAVAGLDSLPEGFGNEGAGHFAVAVTADTVRYQPQADVRLC